MLLVLAAASLGLPHASGVQGGVRVLSGLWLADNRFVQHTNSFPPLSHTPHALLSAHLSSCGVPYKTGCRRIRIQLSVGQQRWMTDSIHLLRGGFQEVLGLTDYFYP